VIQELWLPVSIIGGLGLLFGLSLAYASKKFEVKVDERIALVREVLPGANCAACGQTGCDAFAEAVVNGNAHVNGCPVGGASVAKKIGEILDIKVNDEDEKVARVMCRGSMHAARIKFDYYGIEDCSAAANLFGGPSACSYGCVGMGSCVRECPFDAIAVEDGIARVLEHKCTSCGKCVAACPKKIIRLIPRSTEYTVACSSLDKGNIVKANCDVGCIGCGKCVRACPETAIKLNGTLAEINPDLCENCGECIKACPTNAINLFRCYY
jgi:Na+-translocating ferredoxin:NAD+ oxidoreductase RNF subunit RnfB